MGDNKELESIAQDAAERDLRKRFVQFAKKDELLLREMDDIFQKVSGKAVDNFYEHLEKFEDTKRILHGHTKPEILKPLQKEYLLMMAKGVYDTEYFRHRLNIGKVHDRINLPTKYYIGQYQIYYGTIIPAIVGKYRWRLGKLKDALLAFTRLSSIDMQLAMDAYIGSYTSRLLELAGKLTSAAENLASSVEEANSSVEQVSSGIEQISKGAQTQAERLNEVKERTREAVSVAKSSAAKSQDVEEAARVGASATVDATAGMDRISQSVGSSAKSIRILSDKSQQIRTILEAINNIAKQTNLLALNAAIEAARAGEAGRGFAVVAEEVRRLSDGTEKATKQIALTIEDILAETSNAVKSMDESATEVGRSSKVISGALIALQAMAGSIEEISTSNQRLVVNVEHIDRAMNDIASVAEGNASVAEQASAATLQQTHALEQLATQAQDLAHEAEKLTSATQRFERREPDEEDSVR